MQAVGITAVAVVTGATIIFAAAVLAGIVALHRAFAAAWDGRDLFTVFSLLAATFTILLGISVHSVGRIIIPTGWAANGIDTGIATAVSVIFVCLVYTVKSVGVIRIRVGFRNR